VLKVRLLFCKKIIDTNKASLNTYNGSEVKETDVQYSGRSYALAYNLDFMAREIILILSQLDETSFKNSIDNITVDGGYDANDVKNAYDSLMKVFPASTATKERAEKEGTSAEKPEKKKRKTKEEL